MRLRGRRLVAALAAGTAGLVLAVLISSAGADSAPQTVVLGSVTGIPTATECPATVRCTYIAFDGIQFMVAPFDGTITSFSVNSGKAGGQVELRVLSSPSPPQFLNWIWTGAGTGPAETLRAGINTFPVDIPVKQGDTIALDNDSGAPIFDNTSPFAQYASVGMYAPALPDGYTTSANRGQGGYGLLFSATVVSSTVTTATTPPPPPPPPPPVVSGAFESHGSWHESQGSAHAASARPGPLGTTIAFKLDQRAAVTIDLMRQIRGRIVGGACVGRTHHLSRAPACTRSVDAGALLVAGHVGLNTVRFTGRLLAKRMLAPGSYVATIIARNATGQGSGAVGLPFTILAR